MASSLGNEVNVSSHWFMRAGGFTYVLPLPTATAWLFVPINTFSSLALVVVTVTALSFVLNQLLRSQSLRVENFDHAPSDRKELTRYIPVLSIVSIALAGANIVSALSFRIPIVMLALTILSVLGYVFVFINAVLVWRDRQHLWALINNLAPQIVLPYRGKLPKTHLQHWMNILRTFPWPLIVVTNSSLTFDRLSRHSDYPSVFIESHSDLSRIFSPRVKLALYGHNAQANDFFLTKKNVTHGFLGHGESDKPGSASPLLTRYDVIFAAGPANQARLKAAGLDLPTERFRFIGRPQATNVTFKSEPTTLTSSPVVLYTQTWPREDGTPHLSSLEFGEDVVAALLRRGATVYFRPHNARRGHPQFQPFVQRTYDLLAADHEKTGREHRWAHSANSYGLFNLMNDCDVLISDVSGVVADFIATNKPYAIIAIDPINHDYENNFVDQFREKNFTAAPATIIKGDLSNIDSALDELFGPDIHFDDRLRTREFVLNGYDGDQATHAFFNALNDFIDNK